MSQEKVLFPKDRENESICLYCAITEGEQLRQALADAERDMREMAKLLKLHIEVAARTAEIEPAEFEGYDTATQILGKENK
jgi:hypothetical protein